MYRNNLSKFERDCELHGPDSKLNDSDSEHGSGLNFNYLFKIKKMNINSFFSFFKFVDFWTNGSEIIEVEQTQQIIIELNRKVRELEHKIHFQKLFFFIMTIYGILLLLDLISFFFFSH